MWLTNARGNDYSKRHVKYHRNGTREERKKYWNFSWHEIGTMDLPATIDYILKKSNHSQLHYIGHSQGSTSFFVMASERPEYNEKISLMTAMAPPLFMGHVENELLQLNVRYLSSLEVSSSSNFIRQFLNEIYIGLCVFCFVDMICEHGMLLLRMSSSIQAIAEWIGFYEFSKQANELLLRTQNSALCYLGALRNTQLCNHNFSPLVGNITEHVNRVCNALFYDKIMRDYWQSKLAF